MKKDITWHFIDYKHYPIINVLFVSEELKGVAHQDHYKGKLATGHSNFASMAIGHPKNVVWSKDTNILWLFAAGH